MKIGNSADKAVNGAAPAASGDAVNAASTRGASKAGADGLSVQASARVTLSQVADDMAHGTSGAFDAEKVARVKAAIADGSYKINAEAIADKLIANARELLTPRQP